MITIKINKIMKMLIITIIFLVIASVFGQIIKYKTGHDFVFGFVPLFNLDAEQNIPTFFSTMMLFTSGVLLAYIGKIKKSKSEGDVAYWRLLSGVFIFLSIDESCSIHELCSKPMKIIVNSSGFFHFAWIIPYAIFVFGLAAYIFKFFLRLDKGTQRFFLLSGIIFVSGAIGFEMIGGWYVERAGVNNLIYNLIATVEETLEMSGVAIFIFALLDYLNRFYSETSIKIVRD